MKSSMYPLKTASKSNAHPHAWLHTLISTPRSPHETEPAGASSDIDTTEGWLEPPHSHHLAKAQPFHQPLSNLSRCTFRRVTYSSHWVTSKDISEIQKQACSNLWRFFLLFFNEVIFRFWCLSKLQGSRVNVKSSIFCSQRSRNKLIILKRGKHSVSSKF